MHAHAILHTRQAEPPKPIKSLVIPFQLKNIQWVDHRLLRFDISAMVDCAVIVLLDFNVNALRQCFGTERSNNRSFLKTRASLQSHCLKSKKNSHLDTYSAVCPFPSRLFCDLIYPTQRSGTRSNSRLGRVLFDWRQSGDYSLRKSLRHQSPGWSLWLPFSLTGAP
jgi:hypothetical protein